MVFANESCENPPTMNPTSSYAFTIIVPLYNERDGLARLEERLSAYIAGTTAGPACVLLVDDGSTDGGGDLVAEICARHRDFFYLRLHRNSGLSAALKAGFEACASPCLGYIDADLQTDPEDFELLLPYIANYEMVTGIRTKREDGLVKRISSRIANAWRRMMTSDGMSDTGCPLKLFQTDCAKRIPMFSGMHRFLPALVMASGGRVKQVPVHHHPRISGRSKYHLFNRLWGPFIDCMAYRWMRRRWIDIRIESDNLH